MTVIDENRKEACKTYIEQTKLLVTLASAFLIAPVALFGFAQNDKGIPAVRPHELHLILCSDIGFIVSVLLGYVVLGAVAGSQSDGSYDVYRKATRVFSILQLITYLAGLVLFAIAVLHVFSAPGSASTSPLVSILPLHGCSPKAG
jgi:hypothetical protein